MKRFTVILLVIAMVASLFVFAACSSTPAASSAPASSAAESAAPASSAAAASASTVAKNGDFKVGLECNYAPFNWTQSDASDFTVPIDGGGGYADGYDVQIGKKVADGLGKNLVIVKTEWDGLIPALQSNKIDAIIAGMSPKPDRKATIDFSDPYYASTLVIVVQKDGKYASAKSLADFSGAKITGQLDTLHYEVIDEIKGVNKQPAMETFPAMIVALTANKIDGYVSELPGAKSAVASNPNLTYVEFADGQGFTYDKNLVDVSIGIRKGDAVVTQMNQILAGLSKDQREQMMADALKRQPLAQ